MKIFSILVTAKAIFIIACRDSSKENKLRGRVSIY
jgi:hypothetical protein